MTVVMNVFKLSLVLCPRREQLALLVSLPDLRALQSGRQWGRKVFFHEAARKQPHEYNELIIAWRTGN